MIDKIPHNRNSRDSAVQAIEPAYKQAELFKAHADMLTKKCIDTLYEQGLSDKQIRKILGIKQKELKRVRNEGGLTPWVGHAESQDVPGGSEMIHPYGKEKLP